MLTGYKIVSPTDTEFVFKPAVLAADQSFRYRVGKTTERGDSGPMCVFTSLPTAMTFNLASNVLLEVEYTKSKEKRCWKIENGEIKSSAPCIPDTVLADTVTPIRQFPLFHG